MLFCIVLTWCRSGKNSLLDRELRLRLLYRFAAAWQSVCVDCVLIRGLIRLLCVTTARYAAIISHAIGVGALVSSRSVTFSTVVVVCALGFVRIATEAPDVCMFCVSNICCSTVPELTHDPSETIADGV